MTKTTFVSLCLATGLSLSGNASAATAPKPASDATRDANQAVYNTLDFSDTADFEDARRGLIKATPDVVITDANGNTVWDMEVYQDFLKDKAPDSANPSLWRQALLNNMPGLYEVVDGIYQVRSYDLTTMSVIRGDKGWIVIDPMTMTESASAAMDLVNSELSERPVTAVIYTHSHPDHFGGVKGIVSQDDVDSGKVKIIAPDHFMEHVASEMALLGTAMSRRAQYMHAMILPRDERQQIDNGLGKGVANGTFTLLEPTDYVTHTGQTMTLDGVEIEFQMTPEAEADAEMIFYFPQFKALMGAENLNAALHNFLTPRGAKIRDPLNWAKALDQTLQLFGDRSDVIFTSHYWPRWGQENVQEYIAKQRDMIKYLHDQTVRLANLGYKRDEIAEYLALPDALAKEWFNRPYYGNVKHNIKGIYQRYVGFWSGNPATLNPLPPHEAGQHYVDAVGGAKKVMKKAHKAADNGNYRWAATLMNHLVQAQPDNQDARHLQADIFEQLGYQTENGPWRNIYLTGAMELRDGVNLGQVPNTASADMLQALSIDQIFDFLAVRVNGPKAEEVALSINWHFTDADVGYGMWLKYGVLNHRQGNPLENADLDLTLSRATLNKVLMQQSTLPAEIQAGNITFEGNPKVLAQLFGLLDTFTPDFNIVTPTKGVSVQ